MLIDWERYLSKVSPEQLIKNFIAVAALVVAAFFVQRTWIALKPEPGAPAVTQVSQWSPGSFDRKLNDHLKMLAEISPWPSKPGASARVSVQLQVNQEGQKPRGGVYFRFAPVLGSEISWTPLSKVLEEQTKLVFSAEVMLPSEPFFLQIKIQDIANAQTFQIPGQRFNF